MKTPIQENVQRVQERIARAAERSGRGADAVRLIAVTKYVDGATTRELVAAGCRALGESRPQVLWEKSSELADLDIEWHLIGHLQRNKAKRTVPLVDWIHSVDSLRLLHTLNEMAADRASDRPLRVLLEINISGESAKHGFQADELESTLEQSVGFRHLQIAGLMGMAGLDGDLDDARREFAMLRGLRDRHRDFLTDNIQLHELSMGMSGDFEAAIEEGATMVRVGSLLFGDSDS